MLPSQACPVSTLLPAESLVIPGLWILDRLQVGEHMGAGQSRGDLPLQLVAEVVAGLHRPAARHQHMEGHESARTGHPGTQGMEADLLRFVGGKQGLKPPLLVLWERSIEQTGGRFVEQLPTGDHDIQRDCNGDQGVEDRQPGDLHKANAQHHAERGPDIGK